MMRLFRYILIFSILLNWLHAKAINYSFSKPPTWVVPVEIPESSNVSKYNILSGAYLTLQDLQYNLDDDAYFTHDALKIVSFSGITQASQISVTLDTSYQKLIIHYLYIWRRGVKTDRTSTLSFEILKNEENLNHGIYTGLTTIYDNLDDVRKDDIIDFAYTIIGSNPILENGRYLFFPLESTNPVDLFQVRIFHAKEKNYQYEAVGCDSSLQIKTIGDKKEYQIRIANFPAITPDENLPSWYRSDKYFTISSFQSWKEVNQWAQNVFSLPREPNLSEVFSEIFSTKDSLNSKIEKAINYVQDDIRYMGIESGIGSIKPFAPDQVAKQRFGDCKDKSLLLVWLLKKIGIGQAYPVLANTNIQHLLDTYLPNNEIFNHCIVTFFLEGKQYWVDPTITAQGGSFREMFTPNYGKVLVVAPHYDSLVSMPAARQAPRSEITDELFITSFTQPSELTMTSKRTGFEADDRRSIFEYYSTDLIGQQVEKQLKLLFPVVTKTKNMEIEDDIEKNQFVVKYHYQVDNYWEDRETNRETGNFRFWSFKFEPVMLYDEINISSCVERKSDFPLLPPSELEYTVILHFPAELMLLDDYTRYDNPAFTFEETIEQVNSKTVTLKYKLHRKSKSVDPEHYLEYCRQKNEIAEKMPIQFYFPK